MTTSPKGFLVGSRGVTSAEPYLVVTSSRSPSSASRLSRYLNGKVTPSAAMLVRVERAASRAAPSTVR